MEAADRQGESKLERRLDAFYAARDRNPCNPDTP